MSGGLAILPQPQAAPADQLGSTMRRAWLVFALIALAVIGGLSLITITGAVIAPGEVTVATEVKKIAHPRGGVIAALMVRNGDRVRAGQLLVRFDRTVSAASADMTGESIDRLFAREARLRAESGGLPTIEFGPQLTGRLADPEVARLVAEERRLFALNREALSGQKAAIVQQIRQAQASISGYVVQGDVYQNQSRLIAEEQQANDALWEKRYTTLQRRNELRRAAEGVRGNAAVAQTSAAQQRARIAELRERGYLLDDAIRREAGTQLAEVQLRLAELRQNNIVATDTNTRNLVTSPANGVVDKLAFTTIGGVVPAGETILEIVPDRDPLMVVARVSPQEVDQVRPGSPVSLNFSAFDMQTTPQIEGVVRRVGADRSIDKLSGASFFPVEISIDPAELRRLQGLKLRPGMPVEAFIRTGDRTLGTYLFKPLLDQARRAFR